MQLLVLESTEDAIKTTKWNAIENKGNEGYLLITEGKFTMDSD